MAIKRPEGSTGRKAGVAYRRLALTTFGRRFLARLTPVILWITPCGQASF
jgi:hypothetical protein